MLLVSTTVHLLYLTSAGLHARTSVLYARPHYYYLVLTQNHLHYSHCRIHFYVSYILYVIATCIRAHSPASASIADQWALLISSEVNSTTSIMARTLTSIY